MSALSETLAALRDVDYPFNLERELLIVDNASTDGTAELAKRSSFEGSSLRVVREERPGKGHAYNKALAEARGDYLLFCDDDVRPAPNWVSGMLAPLVSNKADAVAGGVELAAHLRREWMTKWHRVALASSEDLDPFEPDQMIGANMAFSRRVLAKVSAFDVELGPGSPLGFGEETVFSMQLREAGFRLAGALDVKVEHHPDASRLRREAWLDYAAKAGKSKAYTDYHWRHNEPHVRALKRLAARLKLLRRQWLHRCELRHEEYCPHWEISLRGEIAYYDQLEVEARRPRNYPKHGLAKVRGVF